MMAVGTDTLLGWWEVYCGIGSLTVCMNHCGGVLLWQTRWDAALIQNTKILGGQIGVV